MADRSVVYRLKADVTQFRAQMTTAAKSVGDTADKMTAANKEGAKFRQGLDSLGGTAGKIGLVAAAGLGAAALKAADFDQSMSNVRAATGETAANMDRLREAALEAGASTAFSATEAAEGIENLAKAGVGTTEIIGGGLAGALDLAAAGQMDVASAAEAAAGAMAQFKLEGSDVPHIADLLAAGAGKAQGDVSDMVMALKQAGTVSAQTGLTLEETTGSLAAMAEQSLLGSDAGTSFKTMLASLTPNSEKAAAAMEQYNISAFDAQGNFVGMAELAGQLRDGLGGLTDEQRAMTLETIFGSDAVRAASIIYDNGAEGIQNWINKTDDAGYAAEQAAARLDNLKGDVEELGGALETALIGTGDGSQGMLRGITQGLTKVVNAYNDLPSAAQSATAGILGVTAAAGGGLWAFSKTVQGIAGMREAMGNLGISANSTKGKLKSAAAFMGGPWGIALTGATVAVGLLMNEQAKAEGYVDSLTAALDDQTGAMTRQTIASNLQDEGWLDYAESVGLSSEVVVDAALGSAEAMEQVNAAANKDNSAWFAIWDSENWTKDADQFVDNVRAQSQAQKQAQENARQLAEAEGEAAGASGDAAAANLDAASATSQLGGAMSGAAGMTEDQAKALEKAREAARSTAQSFLDLTEGVRGNKATLGGWIKEMHEQADALHNFRVNAEEAGKRGVSEGLIAHLRELGPEGAKQMKWLANATDEQIDRANAAWRRAQREAREYERAVVDAAGAGPVNTKVNVDADNAMSVLYRLREFKIGDKTITIHTQRVDSGGVDYLSGGVPRRAAGGPVFGPGTATSDSIPALLSNGEHVWTAREVANAGGHAAIMAMRSQFRFAQGGAVGVSVPAAPAGASIDYDRLAGAMLRARPMYGDVHISGDPSEWKRQQMIDRQTAGMDGVRRP